MTENLAEQARGLRADITGLATSVTALAVRSAQSERTVKRMHRITIALVVGLVLIVGLAAYSVVLGHRLNTFARCHAAYNAAYDAVISQRTRALTDATTREREAERARGDALDAVFLDPSLLKPADQRTPEDQKRIRALFATYLDAAAALRVERVAADKARAANPVPPLPQTVCG